MTPASTTAQVPRQRKETLPLPLPARQRLWHRLWGKLLAPVPVEDEPDRPAEDAAASQALVAPSEVTAEAK